jgi:glycosyltransferase involved in cell wall biosynthesis
MQPRIVILSAFASPLRSGAEACAEEVPSALKDTCDFAIVTARMRRNLPLRDHINGIEVYRVGLGYTFDKWLFPFLAPITVQHLRPDIVHAVLETFAGLALFFCKFLYPKSKRMLTLQTTNRSFLKKMIIKSPHKVTAISSVLIDIVKSKGRDDVIHISNGLHLKDIPQMKKVSSRIVFVGRLEKWKGVDVLLRAFSQCPVPSAQLRIVGEGSSRKYLEELAESLGIEDHVTFVGFVPVPDVYKEFAEAEIFCGLSRSEALGNVFLEAQAAGCAVIGTTVGGIPDIVQNGETGLLVPPNDIDAAAEALSRLLSDTDLRQRLAENGKRHAQGYDWSIIAKKYEEVYQELL